MPRPRAQSVAAPLSGSPCTGARAGVLAGLLMATGAHGQTFSESFSDVVGLPGSGWFMRNNSEPLGTNTWFQGLPDVFPPRSAPGYIAANSNSAQTGGTISTWLITPARTLSNGDTFQFYTRTMPAGGTPYPDRLQVRLSTAGGSTNVGTAATDVGDFTILLLDINPNYTATGYPTAWQQFTVAVSGLPAPTLGRFAFRYFVENGGPAGARSNYIGIDDAVYTAGGIPTGACCLNTGACILSTQESCTALQGIYRGNNVECGPAANCPQPGACCLIDGSCTVVVPSQCTILGGVYRGDGTTCPANCPQPGIGACCFESGSCQVLTRAVCLAQSGTYRGDDSTCAAANCAATIFNETGDAGELPATAMPVGGQSGGVLQIRGSLATNADADMYRLQICDAAHFAATTVGGATFDTALFLFRADGRGVAFDEDTPPPNSALQASLTSQFTAPLGPGVYYLAISSFDRDPVSSTGAIWLDTPFSVERAPDGPGAANPVTAWDVSGNSSGAYIIRLLGACYLPPACYANCDGSTAPPILNVGDFVCFQTAFAAGNTYANCDGSTMAPVLNVADFVCFQTAFAAGCR